MPVALQSLCSVSIPSRRVGDHKGTPLIVAVKLVSIPSRRVGDLRDAGRIAEPLFGFHPLKAGRRPHRNATHCCGQTRFHPLKAGRRRKNMCKTLAPPPMFPSPQGGSETIQQISKFPIARQFPPLKAGRRPARCRSHCRAFVRFPSPQGGSETT
jgi:hypothetical protein